MPSTSTSTNTHPSNTSTSTITLDLYSSTTRVHVQVPSTTSLFLGIPITDTLSKRVFAGETHCAGCAKMKTGVELNLKIVKL